MQAARNFHKIDVNALMLDGETVVQMKERLQEEEDPMGPLLEISQLIDRNLITLRKLTGTQKQRRH